GGLYVDYAFGRISDRCFVIPPRSQGEVPTKGADGALARLRLPANGVYGMYGHLPYDHVRSLVRARRHRAEIESVERFCMFIGHARSGHSIVGAALDAHPNIVTAHEANALLWLRGGMSRR